jgi:hypothetical protein
MLQLKKITYLFIEKYKQLQGSIPSVIKNANILKPINLGDKTQDGIHPNQEGNK